MAPASSKMISLGALLTLLVALVYGDLDDPAWDLVIVLSVLTLLILALGWVWSKISDRRGR